ncbi:YetF domain-containing protein [Sulfitobacter sp. HNIBRBA3233]|uniref:DUF421 domain-containing protein n=1 Tax=Sulfitobacter marinivivus TaxID=3158558 RepID=UPI0032DF8740
MDIALQITLRAALTIAVIIALTRIHGLRSFSKMSGFDFAITVSIGSVLAGAVTTLSTPVWHFVVALVALFIVQFVTANLRARSGTVECALDNGPLLVMEKGTVLEGNLLKAGMTRSDLWAKLREANAYQISNVFAVVVESTGDVSVLHGTKDDSPPSDEVMQGVLR